MIRLPVAFLVALAAASCSPARPNGDVEKLVRAAGNGDEVAQYDLAVEYYVGKNVPQDYAKAAALWRPLAERGHPAALNNVGYLTYYGLGVPEDPAAGVALWRKAVSLGEAESSFHLGLAALDGTAMPRDSVEAFARLRAAMLMARAPRDPVEQKVVADAAEKLGEVSAPLSAAERARGEALARGYATLPAGRESGSDPR